MRGKALRHPLVWICLFTIIGAVSAGRILTAQGQADQESAAQRLTKEEVTAEPIVLPFSHNVHVEKVGVQCLFCHSSALRAPQASLPSLEKCMICHAAITVEGEEAEARVAQVVAAFEEEARVQWPDVYKQPDFVYFSHRPHIANGVSCQTCHGEVQQMALVEKTVEMNMGFCLDCHRQEVDEQMTQEQEQAVATLQDRSNLLEPHVQQMVMPKLLDCSTCHK